MLFYLLPTKYIKLIILKYFPSPNILSVKCNIIYIMYYWTIDEMLNIILVFIMFHYILNNYCLCLQVCGSIVAYLVLVVSFLYNRF